MAPSFKVQLRKSYKAAKRELNDLLRKQQKLEKDIVIARQTLQNLGRVCQAAKVRVVSSSEAAYLLQRSALGDEVRSILIANYPAWTRPNQVVAELERIGHDLSKLSNPQASIQMILKRMVENGEAQEQIWAGDGKKIYRIPRTPKDVETPNADITLATVPERGTIRLSDLLGSGPLKLDPEKIPDEAMNAIYELAGIKDHPVSRFQSRFKSRFPSPRSASVARYTKAGQAIARLEAENKPRSASEKKAFWGER